MDVVYYIVLVVWLMIAAKNIQLFIRSGRYRRKSIALLHRMSEHTSALITSPPITVEQINQHQAEFDAMSVAVAAVHDQWKVVLDETKTQVIRLGIAAAFLMLISIAKLIWS